jgi:hypothetical protein
MWRRIYAAKLRDTIVSFILEKLTLSPAEEELLLFASIFRLPCGGRMYNPTTECGHIPLTPA